MSIIYKINILSGLAIPHRASGILLISLSFPSYLHYIFSAHIHQRDELEDQIPPPRVKEYKLIIGVWQEMFIPTFGR